MSDVDAGVPRIDGAVERQRILDEIALLRTQRFNLSERIWTLKARLDRTTPSKERAEAPQGGEQRSPHRA